VDVSYIIGSVSVSELRVPQWIPQLTLPIGFALLGLEFIARILVRIGLVRRGIAAVEAVEST
jgi:TRAP-type mannitol/chloroaromatic compound transport system permease small subunit